MSAILDRLKRAARADTKKTGLMVALVAVGLLLWGRLLLKQVPKTATATPEAAAEASPPPLPGRVARVTVDFPGGLDRDLFAIDPSRYKRIASENERDPQTKSDRSSADRALRIDEARRRAKSLSLQSVILSAQPRAVIDGRPMRVGQRVEGFELVEIHERSVILQWQDVRIRLSL